MKNIINVSIGGRSFTLDEEAYNRLNEYLEHYRAKLSVPELQKGEVMEDIERRIAELFADETSGGTRVVSLPLVEKVAATLGMPDGSAEGFESGGRAQASQPRKLYRDPDMKAIGGVCSGLSHYLDVDLTVIRVFALIALILGSAGFWIYVILWIAVPLADTPAKKCDMYGIPPTAENMSRFARNDYKKR
ncbi:MAG: PspC domain-containing protein [Bacteroidales bacterium]|nr:PspC domain-containing protein [Bacteroidales bacterium]